MSILVTGAAGFIGSHLLAELASKGCEVRGIDILTHYYSSDDKKRNLALSRAHANWNFQLGDVADLLATDLDGVDTIVHLAAQPGVRNSWTDFDTYLDLNLRATANLAAAAVAAGVRRIVFASSSSVYGDDNTYPTQEEGLLHPKSPYGVTKLAGEALLRSYSLAHPLEIVALRFFTVYGPGQRPDMAIQRLVRAGIDGSVFQLFGTGEQRRDFTYVDDVVRACIAACEVELPSPMVCLNVGGSGDTSMNELIQIVEKSVGNELTIDRRDAQKGDVSRTGADISKAKELLGWEPAMSILEGVGHQVAFERDNTVQNWVRRAEAL